MFINTGALLQADTPNEIIGVIAHEAGQYGGRSSGLAARAIGARPDHGHRRHAAWYWRGSRRCCHRQYRDRTRGHGRRRRLYGDGSPRHSSAINAPKRRRQTAGIKYLAATASRPRDDQKQPPAFPKRALAFGRSGRPVPDQPSDAARPHRQSGGSRAQQPELRQGRSSRPPIAPRYDAREDRHLHAGSERIGRGSRARASIPLRVQYGQAIGAYLNGSPKAAIVKIDALIKQQPKNAYFHELRGDALMKVNRPKDAATRMPAPYNTTPPAPACSRLHWAEALLAVGQPASVQKAVPSART